MITRSSCLSTYGALWLGILGACRTESPTPDAQEAVHSRRTGLNELLSVEQSMVGGREIVPGVSERSYHVRADLRAWIAEAVLHSPTADREANPIGTFRAPLSAENASALIAACRASDFRRVPPPAHGCGLGSSLISLKCMFADGPKEAAFLSRNMAALQHFQTLLGALDPVLSNAMELAVEAARLEVPRQPDRRGRFRVVLRNIGRSPLAIVPPRRSEDLARSGVQVADVSDETPGVTSYPEWTLVPLSTSVSSGRGKPVILMPHAAVEFLTARWRGKPGASYVAQAVLSAYDGSETHQSTRIIKGRLFSERVTFRHP